jgi:anti-sigma regulatory factor (Ser/Thr protein kinase)
MRVTIHLRPRAGQLRHVRRLVEIWTDAMGVEWDTLALITTELVSNALAASPPHGDIEVTLDASDHELCVSVRDAGSGLKSASFSPPPPTSRRGRGLAIVDHLADQLTIDRLDGRTLVTARVHRRSASRSHPRQVLP